MLTDPDDELEPFPFVQQHGKDEMNFAEFPITLLTDRVPRGQKSIKFEDQIFDERRKKLVTRKRVIEGSEEYGLPTATDDAVILALIQITKLRNDFLRRDVEFTRLELIRMLEWPNEGKSYDRIKLSLQRIANVTYNYDNAWWDPRQKTWTTKSFHIIDTVEINDSRASDGAGRLFPSRIVWNEVVFDSFQAGFLRNINFQLCMRLKHPTALRMYRFLGKRFHYKPDWMFDLKEFAYEHIGLGRNYEGGTQIARKLQPALDELEDVGFLEPLGDQERFPKNGRDWRIRLLQKSPAPLEELVPPKDDLIAELVVRGVSRTKAVELCAAYSDDAIRAKLEVFDWLSEKQDKRVAKSPAGYLVKSIVDDYAVPKGFETGSSRREKAEASKEVEGLADEERRKGREETIRRKAAEAYWNSLSPEQQVALDAAAMASAPPEMREMTSGPLRRMSKTILRFEYIGRLLKEEDPVPASQGTLPFDRVDATLQR